MASWKLKFAPQYRLLVSWFVDIVEQTKVEPKERVKTKNQSTNKMFGHLVSFSQMEINGFWSNAFLFLAAPSVEDFTTLCKVGMQARLYL